MGIIRKPRLKNSQRDNRRYLLIGESDNSKIEKAILDYIGILGLSKSAYLKVGEINGKTIGAIKRECLEEVMASLALARLHVFRVSGTLKGLKDK